MQKVFNVAVDIGRKLHAPAFDVNTNDLKSVKLLITITNGQTLLDLTDTTVRIAIRKPDNNIIFQDCTIKDAKTGQVEIVLENQAYITPGTHTAEIMCYKGSEVVAVSGTFSYKSTKGIMNDEAVESKSEFTSISNMMKDVQDTIDDIRKNGTGVDAKARQDIQSVTTQLAETAKKSEIQSLVTNKADKSYVDQVTQSIASGSPKGTYATKAALDAAFPTGNTNIYIVTADGKWYYWNGTTWTPGGTYQSTGISDGAISYKKTDFTKAIPGKNMYNHDSRIIGQVMAYTTGNLTSNSSWDTSDFIVITAEKHISANKTIRYACFDSNKTFISGGYDVTSFAIPEGTAFIRLTFPNTTTNLMINEGTVSLPYESYEETLLIPKLKIDIKENSIGIDEIKGASLDTSTTNLFVRGTALTGKVSVNGTVVDNPSYTLSDYIPVEVGKSYTVSHARSTFATLYDANKNFVGILDTGDNINYTFTVQSGSFIRLNIYKDSIDNYRMVKGITMVQDSATLEWLKIKEKSIGITELKNEVTELVGNPPLKGKVVYTFGDSITWYDGQRFVPTHFESGQLVKGYQSYMREQLGATVINKGISGMDMSRMLAEIQKVNFTSGVDYVTITSGANDWSGELSIGSVIAPKSSFNTVDFCGALQAGIEYILGQNPNVKIFLMTPIRGYHPTGTHAASWQTGYIVDGMLEQPSKFADAIMDIGKLYGLPVIDLRNLTGMNFKNYATFLKDDPSQTNGKKVHPGNAFYKRMAEVIVPFFKNN